MKSSINSDISAFYDAWFRFNAVYERWAKAHGLSSNLLFLLYLIRESPGSCTQKLLCERLLLPKQTVNSMLDALEHRGYVERRAAPGDRRSRLISLTKAGEAYAIPLLEELLQFERRALGHLSGPERAQLLRGDLLFVEALSAVLDELDGSQKA